MNHSQYLPTRPVPCWIQPKSRRLLFRHRQMLEKLIPGECRFSARIENRGSRREEALTSKSEIKMSLVTSAATREWKTVDRFRLVIHICLTMKTATVRDL